MIRRNRLRRAALVLALLLLAAIVTGVAASATKTAVPKWLIGKWESGNGTLMVVGPRGKVNFSKTATNKAGWWHAEFSHVTAGARGVGTAEHQRPTVVLRAGDIHLVHSRHGPVHVPQDPRRVHAESRRAPPRQLGVHIS